MDPYIDPPSMIDEDENNNSNLIQQNAKNILQNLDRKPSARGLGNKPNQVLITNLETNAKSRGVTGIVKGKSTSNSNISGVSNNKITSNPENGNIFTPPPNLQAIDNFEKNLKKGNFEYNYDKMNDSDYEEDLINEDVDLLTDKNELITRYKIIQDKLKEKSSQIAALQRNLEEVKRSNTEFMDLIAKDPKSDIKDKKLIELVKKNKDLKLKIEKFKLKEKELEAKLNELKSGKETSSLPSINTTSNINANSNSSSNNITNNLNSLNPNSLIKTNDEENRKRLKQLENKVVEMRNKLQSAKEENTKLNILIKREIGESIDIDKALKDKVYWKGRAEIIESLKTKVKILEAQVENFNNLNITNNSNTDKVNNSMTEDKKLQSVKTNIIPNTNVVPFSEYKKEKESLKFEIEKLREDNGKLVSEYSRFKSRTQVLEKELKQQKDDLTQKIKILIEKSDNDEKLIFALNKELEKKGSRVMNFDYENSSFNLQQEINKLRQEIKEKDTFINNLNSMFLSNGDSSNREGNSQNKNDTQWNMQTIGKIISRLKELEDQNKKLKNQTDDGKIFESLAKENAKLRLKIKDLEDQICNI